MFRTFLILCIAVAFGLFAGPAMAVSVEGPPPVFDDSTADTMFLFIPNNTSGMFPGTASTGASYTDSVAIFNIGGISQVGFPFSGIFTPGPISGSFGSLATDGRNFLFLGGLNIFTPFDFGGGEALLFSGDYEGGPYGTYTPHMFIGQETDQTTGDLVETPPAGIDQDIQEAWVKMLANMDLLDPALLTPGGFVLDKTFNDLVGLLGDSISEVGADLALSTAKGPVFDDSFSGLVFDVATSSADGFEQVFAFDPTQGGTGFLALTSSQLTVSYRPVPEPGSLALIGLGLAGIGVGLVRRRRRRSRKAA